VDRGVPPNVQIAIWKKNQMQLSAFELYLFPDSEGDSVEMREFDSWARHGIGEVVVLLVRPRGHLVPWDGGDNFDTAHGEIHVLASAEDEITFANLFALSQLFKLVIQVVVFAHCMLSITNLSAAMAWTFGTVCPILKRESMREHQR